MSRDTLLSSSSFFLSYSRRNPTINYLRLAPLVFRSVKILSRISPPQHSVLFRDGSLESLYSHKPSNVGSRISGRDRADAASSPESFESARDAVREMCTRQVNIIHSAMREDKKLAKRAAPCEILKLPSTYVRFTILS